MGHYYFGKSGIKWVGFKSALTQVEFIDENVDHPNWIFFGDVIFQELRQQHDLRPNLTFNESLHERSHHDLDDQKISQSQVFSHSLGQKQSFKGVYEGRDDSQANSAHFAAGKGRGLRDCIDFNVEIE
ncbi:hypothetical protein [Pseudomonas sp. I2]|uniref:hypothetical protein n=1 Tax=Pseudomonas sp. I2 TaxID=1338438 RepID=UPI0034D48552